ncbi:MAG TPA: Clp protease ClpP, partial [Thiotrichales bacterium]|nr:Clp protease ClpP [Thiotrichales bacterium]
MKWFDAKARANESSKLADIKLYSDIGGYGITAGNFIKEVQSFGDVDTIKVSINSTGGSVVDAIAITNFLIYHKAKIIIQIDGIAASAASLIAMSGDEIIMPENAMMMVHYPWTDLQGNAEEIRATAEALYRMGEAMAGTYARKTGQTKEQIHALLRDEKWLSAKECLELGFCTKIVEPITAKSAAHIENL